MDAIGKYQLVAEIARGGMGIVYLAVVQGPGRFNKLLCLKELKPELGEDRHFLEMFLEEARLAARLAHPNIVQTYDIGSEGNRHYMVMDYLEGVTLSRIMKKEDSRFSLHAQIKILCEVLEGLHYAHNLENFDGSALGIVHRDATPHNVFVTFDGQVKLVDFGIAKALDSSIETRTGIIKGKPTYMAPEQMGGDVDPRADIFAVGVMLWEAVAGKRMWQGRGDIEVLTSIMRGQMPSLREAAPNAPEALLWIVERAVHREKERRYSSAKALKADLESYLRAEKASVDLKEIGELVAEMFADERAKTRAMIDAKIGALAGPSGRVSRPSGTPPPSFKAPSLSETPRGMEVGASGQHFASMPAPSMQAPNPGGTLLAAGLIGAIVAVIALVGGGAILWVSKSPRASATASASEVAPAAPPPATARAEVDPPPTTPPSPHAIEIRVVPANAQITLDGQPVTNPVKRTCMSSDRVLFRATAPGYAARVREIACDRDESLELLLQPAGSQKAAEVAALDAKSIGAHDRAAATAPSPIENTPPPPDPNATAALAPPPIPPPTREEPAAALAPEGVVPFAEGMTRPSPILPGEIQYTREAREANVQGTIIVRCVITTTGATESCRIMKGLPFMDQAVLSALARHRGTPVMSNGRPVTAEYTFTIRLKRD